MLAEPILKAPPIQVPLHHSPDQIRDFININGPRTQRSEMLLHVNEIASRINQRHSKLNNRNLVIAFRAVLDNLKYIDEQSAI